MEQLQVIQSFLHAVPQGRKMVEEVSKGLGRGRAGSIHPFLPWDPLFSFMANLSLYLLLFCLPPPFLGPAPSLLLSLCPLPSSWHQVDRAITACAELHDLKEAVLKHQRKLDRARPESSAQVRRGGRTAASFVRPVGWLLSS